MAILTRTFAALIRTVRMYMKARRINRHVASLVPAVVRFGLQNVAAMKKKIHVVI